MASSLRFAFRPDLLKLHRGAMKTHRTEWGKNCYVFIVRWLRVKIFLDFFCVERWKADVITSVRHYYIGNKKRTPDLEVRNAQASRA